MKFLLPLVSLSGVACGALAPFLSAAQPEQVVIMDRMVVEDSKAGIFCFALQVAEPPRVWVRRTDGVPETGRGNPVLKAIPNVRNYLVPLRSFELRDGDEVIRIGDRLVAEMPQADVLPALLSGLNPQPVILEVQRPGEKKPRIARYVLQSEVRAGVKVPRP